MLQTKKNLVWILLLNFVSIATLFIVYRIIYNQLGQEEMGLWSLVSASASLGIISNFGVGSGLIKFTAEAVANNNNEEIKQYAGTANVSNIFFSLPFIAICYYASISFAKTILTTHQFHSFKYILPISMLAIYFNNLASTYLALLDGYQKFSTRCFIQIIGFLLFGIAVLLLMKKYGLVSVSYALCLQSIIVLLLSILFVRNLNISSYFFPLKFEKTIFKKLISYGLKFQLINILVFLFEPTTKFFITKIFGLPTTAIYELSSKLVIQGRTLVVNLLQVMVPQVASYKKNIEIKKYVTNKLILNSFLSINMMILMLFIIPIASHFFMGSISTIFIIASILLLFGWLINMLVAPIYFAYLGIEKLNVIIINHILTSVITVGLFFFFGVKFSNIFSFIVPSIGLIFGSIYLIIKSSQLTLKPFFSIIKNENLFFYFFATSALLVIIFLLFYKSLLFIILGLILFIWILLLKTKINLQTIF